MVYWDQIRKTGGLPDLVKSLIEQEQRRASDSAIEDVGQFWQSRLDEDRLKYADDGYELPPHKSATDPLGYSEPVRGLGDLMVLAGGFHATNNYGWARHDSHKLWLQFPHAGRAVDATETVQAWAIGGAPTLIPGIISENALRFTDTQALTNVGIVPHDFSTNVIGSYGFWFRMKHMATGSNVQIFNPGINRLDVNVERDNGKIFVWFHDSNNVGRSVGKTGDNMADDQWHFLFVNKTATDVTFYIDRVVIGTFATTLTTLTTANPLIGAPGTTGLVIEISDVVIFSRDLTSAEHDTVMARGQLEQPFIPDFSEMEVLA